MIIGSALTDNHVAAIRKLTDDHAPKDVENDIIRNIQHDGPNRATNIWQGSHYESYQELAFTNGKWEIKDTGGGFGTFR